MNGDVQLQREVREILIAAAAGETSDQQRQRLNQIVVENEDIREYVCLLMQQIGLIRWSAQQNIASSLAGLESCLTVLGQSTQVSSANKECSPETGEVFRMVPIQLAESQRNQHGLTREGVYSSSIGSYISRWGPLALAALISAACTLLVTRSFYDLRPRHSDDMAASALPIGSQEIPNAAPFVARLVSNTGEVWNASLGERLESGDRLRTKETITIQEGTAKLELVSGLTLHLKGPAMVSVDSDGMPLVQYGKVVASLPWGAERTAVKASLGVVQFDGDDIAGIAVFGGSMNVDVFQGEVLINPQNPQDETSLLHPFSLSSGSGKVLRIEPTGKRSVHVSHSGRKLFESWNALTSDRLSVTDSYVAAVRESQPVAYWRFEKVVDGRVLNEISDGHHATIGGKARLVPQGDNRALEFGFGPESGYLLVEDPFNELAGKDYAFELWMKPNHYHRGTVVGLVDRRTRNQEEEGTAFLLETVDERAYIYGSHRPFSLRFLHRSPPGSSLNKGKSCYSSRDYVPGKWQHVVTVKQGPQMRLYVDGKVLGSDEDHTAFVSGLNLVVGQLYSFGSVRPYVGQIDELAVYDHALTTKEIEARYELLR